MEKKKRETTWAEAGEGVFRECGAAELFDVFWLVDI